MTSTICAKNGWRIAADATAMHLTSPSGTRVFLPADTRKVNFERRWFRWYITFDRLIVDRLAGMRRLDVQAVRRALDLMSAAPDVEAAREWRNLVETTVAEARNVQRWIPRETVERLEAMRPTTGALRSVEHLSADLRLDQDAFRALRFLNSDLTEMVRAANEEIVAAELVSERAFFDTIESSPLTEEQARTVICFDNRVQTLAAAGSGKTSVMVARAAYAVKRGFVRPDRILLLAFNSAAAKELQERVSRRFTAAGLDATGIRATTFHAFGLDVIGQATGEKPRVATWLDEGGSDVGKVSNIAQTLCDESDEFRYDWHLFRLVYARLGDEPDEPEFDAYDSTAKESRYRTFSGALVRSKGERAIADFLFLNNVDFEYERPYVVNVADATHSQYRPDFYYPDIDCWHEHWAVDSAGRIPKQFVGYRESMAWKRETHARYGTTMLETTWGEVQDGLGIQGLARELTARGIAFDWDPHRRPNDSWARPVEDKAIARLCRTFMTHVKSNGWTREALQARLSTDRADLAATRTLLFLKIYWQIHDRWQAELDRERDVDFEDMLATATAYLESGRFRSAFDLVLVDEFQDASSMRARMIRGLVTERNRYLLAVGDDWQSINRFAGSDVSVMTEFERRFGSGPQTTLATTFRCAQTICDVASKFVMQNPAQFSKRMTSVRGNGAAWVYLQRTDDPQAAVNNHLARLSAAIADGTAQSVTPGRASVFVLFRYRFEANVLKLDSFPNLDVKTMTVHRAKGLEADYVIVPNLISGTYGFPADIEDDPVLDLVMPHPEDFPHAEERRLLYVAMTRARFGFAAFADGSKVSPFFTELLDHEDVISVDDAGDEITRCPDPECKRGVLVTRSGRYGEFRGCSRFPACTYTENAPGRD